MSSCLFICLSICLSVYLFVCLMEKQCICFDHLSIQSLQPFFAFVILSIPTSSLRNSSVHTILQSFLSRKHARPHASTSDPPFILYPIPLLLLRPTAPSIRNQCDPK